MSQGRTTEEILRGLTLPAEDGSTSVLGSAQINVNEVWREFVRVYGQEGDVARLVRGAALPIGGDVTITVGLETLLGISGGVGAPEPVRFHVPRIGGTGHYHFCQVAMPSRIRNAVRFRLHSIRASFKRSGTGLGQETLKFKAYCGVGAVDEYMIGTASVVANPQFNVDGEGVGQQEVMLDCNGPWLANAGDTLVVQLSAVQNDGVEQGGAEVHFEVIDP